MLGENLIKYRKSLKMTQEDLATLLNLKRQTYSAYERGISVPDAYTIGKISQILGVSIDELMGKVSLKNVESMQKILIPVLGYIKAGLPNEVTESIIDYEEISSEMARSGDYFALCVSGNSMEPRICEGDIVIVRKQSYINSGETAVILINGHEATIKQVVLRGESLILIAINKTYKPVIYTSKEVNDLPVQILGKVVELRAKF